MSLRQSLGDLHQQLHHLTDIAPPRDPGPQRLPRDVLHRDVPLRRHILGLADVVNRKNVRMIQRRRSLRLQPQPRDRTRIAARLFRQNLDGHIAIQPSIARPIHHTHPTLTDRLNDLVNTEPRASCEVHGSE